MADYNDFDWREKANIEIIEGKEAYLVDVPVCVMLWIRPDYQRQQYEVISKAKPSVLFLISDGGRNERENQLIAESRSVYDDISWNCTVYRMYFDKNQGMYSVWKYKTQMIWDCVEYCVFLEDDQIPAITYFDFCRQNLEYYKEDEKVAAICGFNYQGISKNVEEYDYFFSHRYAIWGIAFWKRTFCYFEKDRSDYKEQLVQNKVKKNTHKYGYGRNFIKLFKQYVSDDSKAVWTEFYLSLMATAEDSVFIIPTKNMIKNIGADNNATHGAKLKLLPKQIQRLFFSEIYEINGGLKRANSYRMNKSYDKSFNRALMTGNAWYDLKRKFVRGVRFVIYVYLKKRNIDM